MTTFILTALTLIAFAANSLLCRVALGGHRIDPISFTVLRLVSGAVVLVPVARAVESRATQKSTGSWGSGLALFAYATAFSTAYVWLDAGTGALILFGSVQVTMVGLALYSGERLGPVQWMGATAAIGGLVYLLLPGLSAPNPIGALLMCVAGTAWGVYSIRGRGAAAPASMTAGNFLRATPMAIIAGAIALSSIRLEPYGVALALISGTVTSGLGYVVWYKALAGLTTTQASLVQLLVPIIAAFGGVALLSEGVSARLITSSTLILGGVAASCLYSRGTERITGRAG